ncbi:MAG: hypothetical protein H6706_19150 [Myxococcales bacterium]|nr:hypothetical protein [Myxococcales bacterium]
MRTASLLLALLLGAGTAQSAIVERLDLAKLSTVADAIIVGHVIDTEARYEGTRIVTRARIRAEARLKGAPDDVVVVETLGGEVDGIGQVVSGMARFVPGEHVAVFLERQPTGTWRTVGLAQGKLSIEAGRLGVRVVRDLDGLTLVERDAQGQLIPAASLPPSEDLAGFLADLVTALEPR